MAGPDIRLYSYFRSSCSYRVRIALAHKGLAYEYVPVHLVRDGGEQHGAPYRDLNPAAEVPTIVIDGHTIAQSTAILEYIEETRPDPPLMPAGPANRARVRQRVQAINAGIQPIQNLKVLLYVQSELDGDKREWGAHWIAQGFESVEALLEESAGKYSVGDAVTMADLFLVPQVYNAHRFGVDMGRFPLIDRIDAALRELPAFAAARPEVQPDCPEELRDA